MDSLPPLDIVLPALSACVCFPQGPQSRGSDQDSRSSLRHYCLCLLGTVSLLKMTVTVAAAVAGYYCTSSCLSPRASQPHGAQRLTGAGMDRRYCHVSLVGKQILDQRQEMKSYQQSFSKHSPAPCVFHYRTNSVQAYAQN